MILSEALCLAIQICFQSLQKMADLIIHGRNCRSYTKSTQMKLRALSHFLSLVVFSHLNEGKLQQCVWKTETHKAL